MQRGSGTDFQACTGIKTGVSSLSEIVIMSAELKNLWTSGDRKEENADRGQKKLRCGYTTGSCAAAAAKAAASCLLGGMSCREVSLMTPKGILLCLPVGGLSLSEDKKTAVCYIEKDSGDDPDVTNGCHVYASVSFQIPEKFSELPEDNRVMIDGGNGIGRITKEGFDQPIGAAAINRVPRKMITENVLSVCEEFDFQGRLFVEISIPEGEALAEKTLNPQLGIVGGISVLGTSGIVEPMSEQALLDTIYLELRVRAAQSREFLLLTPGNYGMDFIRESLKEFPAEQAVKCSNFIGETLDYAKELGFQRILLVGHAGKIIKLAAGIMNTHSRYADARMEILAAYAALSGAGQDTVEAVLNCTMTDAAFAVLKKQGLLEKTMEAVTGRILYYLKRRVGDIPVDVVYFSSQYGILGDTVKRGK